MNNRLNLMNKLKNWNQGFIRNVVVLAGSTAFAQVLLVITSPILTRIYSPSDFGVLSAFISILSIVSVVGSLRYELAITLPKEDKSAVNLLILSIAILLIISLVFGITLLFIGHWLVSLINVPILIDYLWLLPLAVVGIGIYQIFNYWAIRKDNYGVIAKTKFTQIVAQVFSQISLGIFRLGTLGLLFGDVIGRIFGAGRLITVFLNKDRNALKEVSFSNVISVGKEYRRFPQYSSLSALINTTGLQLPLLLITTYYGTEISGWFSMSQRMIGIPMLLVGQAVSQVYLGEASKLVHENPKALKSMFVKISRNLFLGGLIPIALLALIAPWLFHFVFGAEWWEAGQYTRVLSFMFLLQFVVVPLSQTLNIVGRQDLQLIWDSIRLILVFGSLYYAKYFNWAPMNAIILYGVVMFLSYLILYWLSYKVIRNQGTKEEMNESY